MRRFRNADRMESIYFIDDAAPRARSNVPMAVLPTPVDDSDKPDLFPLAAGRQTAGRPSGPADVKRILPRAAIGALGVTVSPL
jgi:hypothetical protein